MNKIHHAHKREKPEGNKEKKFPFSFASFLFPSPCSLFLLAALLPSQVPGQTNLNRPIISSNRYLLVLETSRSMEKRSAANLKVVDDLLTSGMAGQLRRGDTLGVWTFNEELYAGLFPLQQWSSEGQPQITDHVLSFLKKQPYAKKSNLAKVLGTLDTVLKNSKLITVIFISSGESPMEGTPFDQPINQTYQLWQQQQQKAHMPLVTVLRAKDGTMINYSVNPAPWHVELPPLPADPPPKVAETKPATPPAKPPMAPPLIISGKKPEIATPKIVDSSPSNSQPSAKSPTSVSPSVPHPQSPAFSNSVSNNDPSKSSSEQVIPKLLTAPPSAGFVITEPDQSVQHQPVEPTKAEHLPKPSVPVVPEGQPPPRRDPVPTTALVPADSHSSPERLNQQNPKPEPPIHPVKSQAPDLQAKVPTNGTSKSTDAKSPEVGTQDPIGDPQRIQKASPVSHPDTRPSPAQATLEVPARSWVTPAMIGTIVLLLLVVVLLFFRLRSQRASSSQTSFITRSFERDRK